MFNQSEKIKFYFDYISPNAYIAWTQIGKVAKKYERLVEPIPVLFAGLLKAHNQLGPAEVPVKLKWMTSNILRKAALLQIPLNPPASHPFNSLLSLRASLIDIDNRERIELINAIFNAVWVEGLDVSNTKVISGIFTKCEIESQEAIDECNAKEVKGKLRDNTDNAIENDVFGVPSMIIDNELFWGYDDFPYMEIFLKGEVTIDKSHLKNWINVKSTAQRSKGIKT